MLKEYFNIITEFERESDEYWDYLSSIAIIQRVLRIHLKHLRQK